MTERGPQREIDYGLAPGERFEPDEDDAPEPPFDPTQPHVMTVLGPIAPHELGLALPFEHVVRRPPGGDADQWLDDPQAALAELEDIQAAGARAVVDATTADDGRDAAVVAWVAARAAVHVVMVTGAADPAGRTAAALTAEFVRDLRDGMEGTAVKAGAILIGMAGVEHRDELLLRATADAVGATGAPVLIEAASDTVAPSLVAARERGLDPARIVVVVGEPDAGREAVTAQAAVETGAFVLLRGVGLAEPVRESARATMVAALVGSGCGDRVLVSSGARRRSQLRAYGGGSGQVATLERFPLAAMEAGLNAHDVRRLLIDNPAQALTIVPANRGD